MPIFDAHMHLGESLGNGMVLDEATHLENCKRYGVEGGIVLPFPVVKDYRQAHDRIAEFSVKNPGFLGAITVNPMQLGEQETIAEMERCVNEWAFGWRNCSRLRMRSFLPANGQASFSKRRHAWAL